VKVGEVSGAFGGSYSSRGEVLGASGDLFRIPLQKYHEKKQDTIVYCFSPTYFPKNDPKKNAKRPERGPGHPKRAQRAPKDAWTGYTSS